MTIRLSSTTRALKITAVATRSLSAYPKTNAVLAYGRILIEEGKAGADKQWLITIALQWTDTFGKQRRLESFLQLELEREGEGIQDVLLECTSNDALKDKWENVMRIWQEQHRIEDLINTDDQFWPVRDANDALLQLLMPFYIPLEAHPPTKT